MFREEEGDHPSGRKKKRLAVEQPKKQDWTGTEENGQREAVQAAFLHPFILSFLPSPCFPQFTHFH